MTLFLYALLFIVSVAVTLGGCALFTNAIEWLGKRLGVSEGAVGSIFAAIGTTLPETSIPVIAIFFGKGQQEAEVGLGAILGAPFMLSTLVLPILALLLVLYARAGKRTAQFHLNYSEVQTDLIFFTVGIQCGAGLCLCRIASCPCHRGNRIDRHVPLLHEAQIRGVRRAGRPG